MLNTGKAPDIAELYTRYGPLVYRRILRFYGKVDAEEVLHEVFLIVLEKMHAFRADASPSTWLYRIATNHCINRLRNHGRRRELLQEHTESLWYNRNQAPHQEDQAFLKELWQDLPEDLVQVGVYHYVDGMTHEEIARIIGVSRRTVGNRLDDLKHQALLAAGHTQ